MANPDPFRTYLDEVRQKLATGMAKEHAYRGALEDLLETTGEGVEAINDSAWIECGAPDFIVLRGATPVGYVEAKDIEKIKKGIVAAEELLDVLGGGKGG